MAQNGLKMSRNLTDIQIVSKAFWKVDHLTSLERNVIFLQTELHECLKMDLTQFYSIIKSIFTQKWMELLSTQGIKTPYWKHSVNLTAKLIVLIGRKKRSVVWQKTVATTFVIILGLHSLSVPSTDRARKIIC